MPTQHQLCLNAQRRTADLIKEAGWLCGLLGDNPNPLTDAEIIQIADSDKSYAWAFRDIANERRNAASTH